MQSEQINKLAEALSKVQGELRGYNEGSANPFFNSRYGSLTDVWSAIRKPLADNGLSVCQTMNTGQDGNPIVVTTLMHSSGQWIRGMLGVTPDKKGPQALGSAITYGRRYSLAAIVGIAPEDDDAEAATDHGNDKPKPERSNRQSKEKMVPFASLTALYPGWKAVCDDDEKWKAFLRKLGIEKGKPFAERLLRTIENEIDRMGRENNE